MRLSRLLSFISNASCVTARRQVVLLPADVAITFGRQADMVADHVVARGGRVDS